MTRGSTSVNVPPGHKQAAAQRQRRDRVDWNRPCRSRPSFRARAPQRIKTIAVVLGKPSASPLHRGPAMRPMTRNPWIITIRAAHFNSSPHMILAPFSSAQPQSGRSVSARGSAIAPGSLSAFGCWLIASLEPAKSRCVASQQEPVPKQRENDQHPDKRPTTGPGKADRGESHMSSEQSVASRRLPACVWNLYSSLRNPAARR